LHRYVGFLWSLGAFDIFQYHFSEQQLEETLMKPYELRFLRLAGKRVIMTPFGTDVMVPGMKCWGGLDYHALCVKDYPELGSPRAIRSARRQIAVGSKYADCIIAPIPYADVLPRCDIFRHYPSIDVVEWSPSPEVSRARQPGRVRICHASNHSNNKGSDIITSIFSQLQERNPNIEFEILSGVSREDAKLRYAEADIVVEQILCGNIGMFGLECLALGKVVLAYLREDTRILHPWMAECPIVNVNPTTLEAELRRLIDDPALRERIGRAGPLYVRKYHSMESIGAMNDQIYRHLFWGEGELPFDPPLPGDLAMIRPLDDPYRSCPTP
jgi:hypothetical protein